jgi:thiamine-phosphate pyrophosphorylase
MKLHALVEDLETARAAVEGGATVVQWRLKDTPTLDVVERGRSTRSLCARHGVTFVVNDDVEAALMLGADGVHLGQSDEGAARARDQGLLLGLSATNEDEAWQAVKDGADYVGVGPIWATPSKPDAAAPIGLEGLEALRGIPVPVIAIGGIDASNAGDCVRAGASGVAVIRAARDAAALRRLVDQALASGGGGTSGDSGA